MGSANRGGGRPEMCYAREAQSQAAGDGLCTVGPGVPDARADPGCCTCCAHKRGYWTLCAGEVLLRFQTSLARGLSTSAHARACAQNDPNELPASLPTPSPGLAYQQQSCAQYAPLPSL